jgi:hypothetical protein
VITKGPKRDAVSMGSISLTGTMLLFLLTHPPPHHPAFSQTLTLPLFITTVNKNDRAFLGSAI